MSKINKVYYSLALLYVEVFALKGKISKYLSFRGYGFIGVEDQEKDIFFHVSKYPTEEIPVQDKWVEFDIEETSKGKEAVNIKIIGKLTRRLMYFPIVFPLILRK